MNIIKKLYESKKNMPDLQIKKISFLFNNIYIVNIQSISSSKDTNDFILKYLSNKSLFSKLILLKDINNYIPSFYFRPNDYLFVRTQFPHKKLLQQI